MIDALRWLVAVEIVAVAFLPVTVAVFRRLSDRGFAFSRILGLLVLTYVVWIGGSFLPIAGPAVLPVLVLLAFAVGGWWLRRRATLAALRCIRVTILLEEGIFLTAYIVWSVLRALVFHPGIAHTEQYMDMMFLNASLHSGSYPPHDLWMSGHTVNYYYFGYLMMAMLIKLSGVAASVGYNLALSLLFAATIGASYSLGLALAHSRRWAALGPLFLAVLGNWHAVFVQGWHSLTSFGGFFESTRVVCCGHDYTINEFPYFSFMLGDLHPHVMALPVTLLALALGLAIIKHPRGLHLSRAPASLGTLLLAAICLGALFATNSWDFPTYGIILAGALAINGYLTDPTSSWWKAPLGASAALAVASTTLYAPFYLHFRSLAHGIGWVSTPANLFQFFQVFGLYLAIAAVLLVAYSVVLQPADADAVEAPSRGREALEVGAIALRSRDPAILAQAVALLALLAVAARFDQWVLLVDGLLAAAALTLLPRVLATDRPNRADAAAIGLLAAGFLVLALTEVIYLRDAFDGSSNYRMNTVFKFYYQGWTLLSLAAAYGVYRARVLFTRYVSPTLGWAVVVVAVAGAAAAAVYTVGAPQGAGWGGSAVSLDGLSTLQSSPAGSGDYDAIRWFQTHVQGTPVELEATPSGDYQFPFSRVSTFTGLPTVLGWGLHELQWRGSDPQIMARTGDVNTIYTTHQISRAEEILRRYDVRYVVAGSTEQQIAHADLGKFARFMRVAYRSHGTTIYTW